MDGAVGKINVRREFSTAAKNATKKRHRRRLPPSFVSTPLTLSNLTHFFTPTEQDRRRAFVRLGFLWGGNQNIVQSQPSLQITPRRLDPRLAERKRGIHAHIALVGAPWSENSSRQAGVNFGHRRRIWRTICYSDDKSQISYAVADEFMSSKMILILLPRG